MGCCGSKDTESSTDDERVEAHRGSTRSRVQAPVGQVHRPEGYGFGRSADYNEQRPTGSRVQAPAVKVYQPEDYGFGRIADHNEQRPTGIRVQAPVVRVYRDEVDGIGRSAQHKEEHQFFQIFFSAMDHLPGYQGILRRWEKEAQQAEYNDGRCEMGHVWLDNSGYVKTLHRVKLFVTNKRFSSADRLKLTDWAMKVVNRRTTQYNAAKGKGKADPKHLKVLEEWRGVKNILQNLL